MRKLAFLTASAFVCVTGCRASPVEQSSDSQLRSLPELPGFTAGPLESTPQYVRRVYSRNGERVAVTLARLPMSAEQYQGWGQMSTATFPLAQAELDVAPGDGNAFHECSRDQPSRCDLLVQLRCGAHLEIRGDGRVALQNDADAIGAELPVRALSELCDPTTAFRQ
jgi:hypothetical protein